MSDVGDNPASAQLGEPDIALFREIGASRHVHEGEYLYREGDVSYAFFVVVSAEVDIIVRADGADRIVGHHGAGRFLGELNMLTGLRVFVSARVTKAGEVIAVPRERLRNVMATNARLGDTILAAFIARRALLLENAAPTIRVVGSRFSPESLRVREFLSRIRVPHEWLDADSDPQVEGLLRETGIGAGDLPVVIATGSVLRNPTPGELSSFLGLTLENLPKRCFDLLVIGGGPAGLAAAVYGASEGLQTLGVDSTAPGGQAGSTSRIENYLGFPMGISGAELTQRAVIQAQKFGARLTAPCAAKSLRENGGYLVVELSDGSEVAGRAVVAATGASYRRLDAARLEDFEGRGVYYAATDMEARQCRGAPVVIVGGGNSAGQAAIYLAQNSCPVSVVIRSDDLAKSMSQYLVDRIEADPAITVRDNTVLVALDGDESLEVVQLRGPKGEYDLECKALFSFIGADPASGWLSGCAALDDRGFVLTDASLTKDLLGDRWAGLGRGPLPFETSRPGLFAVGDLRSESVKRVASAVGEGSAAVRAVHQHLAFMS
jgi:thioredoxin reductase (NADPH)